MDYVSAINSALFETGKPVLITPKHSKNNKYDNIAIAWNNSIESSRSVSYSLPLLKKSKNVQIISISGDNKSLDKLKAEGLKDQLSLHNVNANVHLIERKFESTSKTLRKKIEELDCDMLVMGAYTHNRIREMVLGGVTRNLLKKSKIPLFMSH